VALLIATGLLILIGNVSSSPTQDKSSVKRVQLRQSIQAAIDTAGYGDSILVGPGTYAEQLTITTDGISIIGSGAILTPPSSLASNTCSGLAGNNTQAGICVTGAGVVLAEYATEHRKVLSVAHPISGVLVTGFEIHGFSGQNIAVVGAQHTRVLNNKLIDGQQYGFLAAGSSNTLADGNIIASTSQLLFNGMCMDGISKSQLSKNQVSGYVVGLCIQTKGLHVFKNSIKDCCTGIFVDPGIDRAEISKNHISSLNSACGAGLPTAGVIIDGAINTRVQHNLIEGQTHGGLAGGIVVLDDATVTPVAVASGNVIGKNIFRNNDIDLFVNSTGTRNVVKSNQCS
jgi:hypothetical protein